MNPGARDTVVVGASMGGIETLRRLVARLPSDFPASVFIVQHVPPEAPGVLAQILGSRASVPVDFGKDGESIVPGRVYVAPPNKHLLIQGSRIRLSLGPKENRWRPAIDALFRSAAVARCSRTIGVLLTGYLDDGVSGLLAIQSCGGATVAQDPDDALYPDLPQNAIAAGAVGHVSSLENLVPVLLKLISETPDDAAQPAKDLEREAAIALVGRSDIDVEERMGELEPVTCPECAGPLWRLENDRLLRFRCHTGHAFTARSLLAGQEDSLQHALWESLRLLEERARMLRLMAARERRSGRNALADEHDRNRSTCEAHMRSIQGVLMPDAFPPEGAAEN